MSKPIEVKTRDEFIGLIQQGKQYAGLVETIGYVYWEAETIYFVRTNPEERFARPIYREVCYAFKATQNIVIKTKYTMKVLSPHELMSQNRSMYMQFYIDEIMMERERALNPADATRVHVSPRIYQGKGVYPESGLRKSIRAGEWLDGAIGAPLGVVDAFTDNKTIGWAGNILTAVSIISDVADGEYMDAAGKAVIALSGSYGLVFSVGERIYKTDYMQRQLAKGYAEEYKYNEMLYNIEREKDTPNLNKLNKHKKEMEKNLEDFKKCIDNLGVVY